MISEKLKGTEKTAFKNWVKIQPSKTAACETLGVTRKTLYSVLGSGSGKPETIKRIRKQLA